MRTHFIEVFLYIIIGILIGAGTVGSTRHKSIEKTRPDDDAVVTIDIKELSNLEYLCISDTSNNPILELDTANEKLILHLWPIRKYHWGGDPNSTPIGVDWY
jgi:hypothetical protein